VAAALDPVLEAASAQQEKEQVVAVFAKARAEEAKAEKAKEAQDDARAAKLYSQLKTASGEFWAERKAREQADEKARAAGRTVHSVAEHLDKEVAAMEAHARAQTAALRTAEGEKDALREQLAKATAEEEKIAEKARAAGRAEAAAVERTESLEKQHALQHASEEAERKRLEVENGRLRRALENVTATSAEQVAKARREAGRARAALKEDGEMLQRLKASAETQVQELRKQYTAQGARVQAELTKERGALQKLSKDRAEIEKVADAAVAKVEKLEKEKHLKHHGHKHHAKGLRRHEQGKSHRDHGKFLRA